MRTPLENAHRRARKQPVSNATHKLPRPVNLPTVDSDPSTREERENAPRTGAARTTLHNNGLAPYGTSRLSHRQGPSRDAGVPAVRAVPN